MIQRLKNLLQKALAEIDAKAAQDARYDEYLVAHANVIGA